MVESLYDQALDSPEPEIVDPEMPLDDETAGLIYRGHLNEIVQIGNHEIRIRTLKIGEELEAGLIASKWAETTEAGRALATALVAACVETVDGKPLLESLGPHERTIEAKFDYIRRNWYWVTVKTLYKEYDQLLRTVLDKYDEMLKE